VALNANGIVSGLSKQQLQQQQLLTGAALLSETHQKLRYRLLFQIILPG